MNRQYIGARYVPKFYENNNGVWDDGVSYEALTIVQYNNSSYTSKTPVPPRIGNPADNPEYWALTGNYNGQVEEYRKTVQEMLDMWHEPVKAVNKATDIADDDHISVGDVVQTLGFYSPYDFGAAIYAITNGSGNYSVNFGNGKFGKIIHNGVVNIAQYGASPANTEANNTALQFAINDQIKTIIIPPLNYNVSKTFRLGYFGTIAGSDERYSKLTCTASVGNLFQLNATNTVVFTFSNLNLWDNTGNMINNASGTRTKSTNKAISCVNAVRCRFNNIKINQFDVGIYADNTGYSNDFDRCELHHCNYGIKHERNANAVNVDQCGFDSCVVGVEVIDGLGNYNVFASQFENCLIGCRFSDITQVNVLGNYFDTNHLNDVATSKNVQQLFIENNLSICRGLTTVYNVPSDDAVVTIRNNFLTNPGSTRTELYRGSSAGEKVIVDNNKLMGNFILTPNTSTAVYPLSTSNMNGIVNAVKYLGSGSQTATKQMFQRISGTESKTITLPVAENNTHLQIICDLANGNTITLAGGEFDGNNVHTATSNERVIIELYSTSSSPMRWLVKWVV